MGMEIDPRLEDIALKVDKSEKGNKNDVVLDSDDEKEEFVKKAREAKIADEQIRAYFQAQEIPQETVEGIFGFSRSESAQNASEAAIARARANKPTATVLPDSVEGKAEMFVPASVEDFKKNPSITEIANKMAEKITDSSVSSEDKAFYQAALSTANILKDKPLGTKEEIEKSYKEAKREVEGTPGTKDMRKFKLAVLERLCAYAEETVRSKEFDEVKKEYDRLKATTGYTIDKAYDEVEAYYKNKGSYYKDVLNKLKKTTLEEDAAKLRNEYRNKQKGTEEDFAKGKESELYDQSSRSIKKGIKRDMKADGVYTKTVKKIDRRHGMSTSELLDPYEMSLEKGQDKRMAADNRVETRKRIAYSEEDIKDVLKNDDIFAGLVNGTNTVGRKPLVEQTVDKNGNKTYNITELSNLIRDMISKGDLRANVSDDKNYAEIENVAKELSIRTGKKVTVKDAKHLIDFCGFDRDHKNVFYDIASGVVKGIENAVAPVATGLLVDAASTFDPKKKADFTGKMFNVDLNDYVKGDVNVEIDITSILKINGETKDPNFKLSRSSETKLENALSSLRNKGYNADYILKDNGISLWIKSGNRDMGNIDLDLQEALGDKYSYEDLGAKNSDPKVNRGKAIAVGVGISVAMGVISELMKPYKSEMSIINNYIKPDTTYNDFIYMLDSLEIPQQAKEAYKALALQFVEREGDKVLFYDELGNRVNCDENGHILDKDGKPTEVVAVAKWSDRQGLIDTMNEIGGWYSKTNKHEGYGYALEPVRFKAVEKTPSTTTTTTNTPKASEEYFYDITENKQEVTTKTDRFYGANMFSSWDPMTNLYPGLATQEGMTTSKASRMLKVMQGITDDNYDYDRLKQITDDSFKMPLAKFKEKYANVPGFNLAAFLSVYGASIAGDSTDTKPNENRPNGKEWWSILAPVEITRHGETFIQKVEIEVPDPQRSAGGGKGTTSVHVEGGSKKTTTSKTVNIYNSKGEKIATGGPELLNKYQGAKLRSS